MPPPGSEDGTRVLRCARVVTARGVLEDATLTVRGHRIASVDAGPDLTTGLDRITGPVEHVDGWVVPGFVDLHCHGGGGFDYATTVADDARRARDFHLSSGTTSAVASLVTAELDELCAQLATLAPLVSAGELAGVHLEGPFLSPARAGAHDRSLLRAPDPPVLDRLLAAADGALRTLTLAPELPGALDAIGRLVAGGVRVAVGHTDADGTTVRRALDAGATLATHLFNAMPPLHHRRPGPVPLLLTDPRVTVELVADGVHVHPDVVALVLAAAGPQRVALVSDALPVAGRPDGDYVLGRRRVRVTGGTARLLRPDGSTGALAGSTRPMAAAVANAVRLGVDIPAVARLAATTPAAAAGLGDVGVLDAGRRADLCVLDDTGILQGVLRGGHWVHGSRTS